MKQKDKIIKMKNPKLFKQAKKLDGVKDHRLL